MAKDKAGSSDVTKLIALAADIARRETSNEPGPTVAGEMTWPVECTVGPGLEGAIACESKIGYVNGAKGWLVYRGYDIFDLCAYSTYEETAYLLIHGELPTADELRLFNARLARYRHVPRTMRQLMGYPVEDLNTMAALRLGTLFMRQKQSFFDWDAPRPDVPREAIGSDEDSIAMETQPEGRAHATYEFQQSAAASQGEDEETGRPEQIESAYRLVAGVATITAAIARLRSGRLPIEPDPELGHAANLLYMLTGRRPSPLEERVMDVALILHADHGMNASTFAAMVVASTLSDIYFSVGAGIAALNGPLHGGANEQVLNMLLEIEAPQKVGEWYQAAREEKRKVMGFGHRVYKAYDPRARILGPLAGFLVEHAGDKETRTLYELATLLEREVISTLGKEKSIFPNVDFYSGLVYRCLDIPPKLFSPLFAVSRVAGWTARVLEYLENNRIFRPRAVYTGVFERPYVALEDRG